MSIFRWFKLEIEFVKGEKFHFIERMPNGDAIIVILLKLVALAVEAEADGAVLTKFGVPYNVEMLMSVLDRKGPELRDALQKLSEFEIIGIDERGIRILNWSQFCGLKNYAAAIKKKADTRERMRRLRLRRRDASQSTTLALTETCETSRDASQPSVTPASQGASHGDASHSTKDDETATSAEKSDASLSRHVTQCDAQSKRRELIVINKALCPLTFESAKECLNALAKKHFGHVPNEGQWHNYLGPQLREQMPIYPADIKVLDWFWSLSPATLKELCTGHKQSLMTVIPNLSEEIQKAYGAEKMMGGGDEQKKTGPDGWREAGKEEFPDMVFPEKFSDITSLDVKDRIRENLKNKKGGTE